MVLEKNKNNISNGDQNEKLLITMYTLFDAVRIVCFNYHILFWFGLPINVLFFLFLKLFHSSKTFEETLFKFSAFSSFHMYPIVSNHLVPKTLPGTILGYFSYNGFFVMFKYYFLMVNLIKHEHNWKTDKIVFSSMKRFRHEMKTSIPDVLGSRAKLSFVNNIILQTVIFKNSDKNAIFWLICASILCSNKYQFVHLFQRVFRVLFYVIYGHLENIKSNHKLKTGWIQRIELTVIQVLHFARQKFHKVPIVRETE